jgi:hypothetical protein
MDTHPWRVLRTPNLEVAIRWPGGRIPASLIVDDPMPGLNPMIDHEPAHPHRREIPNTVLHRFADLAERHGLQGKFTVVPWPLALGRLDRPETLPAEARAALPEFVEVVRSRIAPRFDLTCEFLTHSSAIDVRTETPLPETERRWASHATAEEFAAAIGLAARILGDAGLVMDGVTSPWDAGQDNERAYAEGVALAARRRGQRLAWYFLHFASGLDVLPRIGYRDRGTIAVSVVAGGGGDPGWATQYGKPDIVDSILAPDGTGRARKLRDAGLPLVFCTHWQSLYGNGSMGGIRALETLAGRMLQHFGAAVEWVPLRRHAELAAACAGLRIREVARRGEAPAASAAGPADAVAGPSWALEFEEAHPCGLADVELRAVTDEGRRWLRPRGGARLSWNAVALAPRAVGDGAPEAVRVHIPLCGGRLAWDG